MNEKHKTGEDVHAAGGKELIAQIREDAQKEADRIIEEARTAADSKIRSAEGRAERLKKDAEERAAAKAEEINKGIDSSVKIRKKRLRLKKNEEIVRSVFARVRQAMKAEADKPEYRATLKGWLLEAALGLDQPEIIVTVSEAEQTHCDRKLLQEVEEEYKERTGKNIQIHVSEENAEEQGAASRTPDGRLEYRTQVSTLIARGEGGFRRMIYKAFGIEGGA
jgi:V/A-type H+-transporting ATPase subunit E